MSEHAVQERLGVAEIRARARLLAPRLPAGFDPLDPALSARDFISLGLPPRPDPVAQPSRHRFWAEMLHPLPRFLNPVDVYRALDVGQVRYLMRSSLRPTIGGEGGGSISAATRAIGGRWGTSSNWSGATIAARDGGRFTSVEGRWRVPAAQRPRDASTRPPPPGGVWRQSVWLGLDGTRLASRSLPQVGTSSEIRPLTPAEEAMPDGPAKEALGASYHLWVQWWVRGKFYGQAKVDGFPVAPGDEISAELTVVAPDNVRFLIVNRSATALSGTGVAVTAEWQSGNYEGVVAGKIDQEGEDVLARGDAPVEGRHAVWCVERPHVMPPDDKIPDTLPHQTEQFDMPILAPTVFTHVAAALTLPNGTALDRDLTAARRIRLFDVAGGDRPWMAYRSSPAAPGAEGHGLPFPRTEMRVARG